MNDFNKKVSDVDHEFIIKGCKNICPSLFNAKTVKDWVGLRPGRSTVRLEEEDYGTSK